MRDRERLAMASSTPFQRVFPFDGDRPDRLAGIELLLGTFFVLQLALDVFTTHLGLSLGFWEANPFMAPIVHHLPLFLLLKAGEAAVFVGIARTFNVLVPGGAIWVYASAGIAAMFPVVHNIRLLIW